MRPDKASDLLLYGQEVARRRQQPRARTHLTQEAVMAKPGPKPRPVEERFWEKVNKDGPIPPHRPDLGPCWLWTASVDQCGYGWFWVNRTIGRRRAHCVAHEWEAGPIPEGLERDHLCRTRPCIRPSHVEAVTHLENSRRGVQASATSCVNGHLYDDANTYRRPEGGRRGCRICVALRSRRYKERRKKATPA